jgi:hypothetical protein
MNISSYFKAVCVLLLTFVSTALFMVMLFSVLRLVLPKTLNDIAGAIGFAIIVLFAGACLQYFASTFSMTRMIERSCNCSAESDLAIFHKQ